MIKRRPWPRANWLLAAILVASIAALPVHAAVRLPTGEYTDSVEDIKLKVLGGYVTVKRTWTDGRWYVNPAWADLKLTFDSLDGSVKGIERAGTIYERSSPGLFIYRVDQPFYIQSVSGGFRWYDTKGNWVMYDSNGHLTSYGDRNNVRVTFILDGNGNRTQILDHFGQSALTFQYSGDQLIGITDRVGRQVRYQYTGNNLTQVTDVLGNAWLYTYDGNGQLTSRTDPNGHTTTIVYAQSTAAGTTAAGLKRATIQDSASATSVSSTGATPRDYKIARVFTVTDPENNTTTYLYDYDRVAQVYTVTTRYPGSRTAIVVYDSLGRLRLQTSGTRTTYAMTRDGSRTEMAADERGLVTKTDYDGNWNPIKLTYPDGTSTSTIFDSVYSNPLSEIDEAGVQTSYQYDAHGNVTLMTEAVGLPEQRITTYSYDQYGQRLTMTRKGSIAADDATTQWTYDGFGNMQTMIDAVGNASAFASDVMGNVLSRVDPRGNAWTRTYNAMGWVRTQIDPLGHGDIYDYDKVGNSTKFTDALGNSTISAYSGNNWLTSVTDALGGVEQHLYDGEGRKMKDIDANGVTKTYAYDSDGRLSTVTDGNGNVTRRVYGDNSNALNGLLVSMVYPTFTESYKYDARSRVTQTIKVLDQSTSYVTSMGYDGRGNVASFTDELGRTTQYTYDALKRRTLVTDAIGGVTRYGYDVRNNLVAVTDPNGHATRYVFDKINRQTSETKPLGGTTNFAYDPASNLVVRSNAKGEQRKLEYDTANRLARERQFGATGGVLNTTPSRTIVFNYDARNLLVGYDDGTTSAVYTLDGKGQKLVESVNYGAFVKAVQYTYQANGKKATFTYPDGTLVRYTYDGNNQLKSIDTPAGPITYSTYQWTVPTQTTAPGVKKTAAYDPLLRSTEIKAQAIGSGTAAAPQGSVLLDYMYTYNPVSDIVQRQTQEGAYLYSYDSLDRLISAIPPAALQVSVSNPDGLPVEGYSYDGAHNRLSSQHQPGSWQYNDDNQLLAYGQPPSTAVLQYDANGHTVQRTQSGVVQKFSYDAAERMVLTTDAADTAIASYYYDPMGRRLAKTVGGATLYFQYADEGLTAEFNGSGALQTTYGWRPGGSWGTNPQFKSDSGAYRFYINDRLGTPQQLLDTTGAPVWKADSEAFGRAHIDPASSASNALRFPGQYYDGETDTHFNYFRDYDPGTGRYRQSDPVGLRGGINRYSYVGNNPLLLSDPFGLFLAPIHHWACVQAFTAAGCNRIYPTAEMCANADWTPSWADAQDPAHSYMHGMCNGNAPEDAEEQMGWTEAYIESEIGQCTDRGLANAAHAAQDKCARGHEGCQEYFGGFPGWRHFFGDAFPSYDENQCAVQATADVIRRYREKCPPCKDC